MKCQLCSASSNKIFDASILSKYHISYYYCNTCGFLQTEDPYWLKEAYNDALNVFDTGIMARNNSLVMKTAIILFLFFNRNASYLDHAGGYGIFTRMMRDIGFDFYGNTSKGLHQWKINRIPR